MYLVRYSSVATHYLEDSECPVLGCHLGRLGFEER